jgi:conjugal transfer/entry exclusion protein
MKNILSTLVVGLAIGAASTSAMAQWSVFDPTNWAQNYSQAIAGVKTEISTAKALIQQTQTALDTAKSVKRLTNVESLTDIQVALRLYRQLKDVDGLIDKDFQDAMAVGERLAAQYGASDFSWSEFLSSRERLNKQQRDNAARRYAAVNASLEQNARQRQAIVQQLSTVNGQTEAMQAVGSAVDVLIGQNQQMISMLATNNRVAEVKELNQEADAKAIEASYSAYQKRLREAAAKYKQQ